MPIIKSAKKKLRQDKKRHQVNLVVQAKFKKALKTARTKPTKETIAKAFSEVDTAVKKHIIHINKASRLKSRLIRLTISHKAPNQTTTG